MKRKNKRKETIISESPKNRFGLQSIDFESKILEAENNLKNKELEISELKNQIKLSDFSLKEKLMQQKADFSLEIMNLKLKLELKEQQIIDFQSNTSKSLKTNDKKRVNELSEEIFALKKELEFANSHKNMDKFSSENELAKLSIENENLNKMVKELTEKFNKSKINSEIGFGRETEDLKLKVKRMEGIITDLNEKIEKTSVFIK